MKTFVSFSLLLAAAAMDAQQYSVDWYKIGGSGGTSSGGSFQASGTLGQPEAGGPMAGVPYSVTGGCGRLLAAVQTAGAPTLAITGAGNAVLVSWSSGSPGWTLQQNGDLSTTNWIRFGGTVSSNSATMNATVSPPVGNLFFRLAHP